MLRTMQVLAENNFGDTRSGGLAGPMGLFLIVVLAVATVLLIRNMNARLRRLPDRFPDQRTGAGPADGRAERNASDESSDAPTNPDELGSGGRPTP